MFLQLYEPPHDKINNVALRLAKTQISLGIRPVWSESLLCAFWVAKDPRFLQADSEDSDQTGRTPRLIWVFGGRTCHFVGFVVRRLNYWHCTCTQSDHSFLFVFCPVCISLIRWYLWFNFIFNRLWISTSVISRRCTGDCEYYVLWT